MAEKGQQASGASVLVRLFTASTAGKRCRKGHRGAARAGAVDATDAANAIPAMGDGSVA